MNSLLKRASFCFADGIAIQFPFVELARREELGANG